VEAGEEVWDRSEGGGVGEMWSWKGKGGEREKEGVEGERIGRGIGGGEEGGMGRE